MTLFDSIIECLSNNNKTVDEIIWVGNNDIYMDINVFYKISQQIYDSDGVLGKIPSKLMIIGKDFWLEKKNFEDDYLHSLSECWVFKQIPKKPKIMQNDLISYFSKNELSFLQFSYNLNENSSNQEIINNI